MRSCNRSLSAASVARGIVVGARPERQPAVLSCLVSALPREGATYTDTRSFAPVSPSLLHIAVCVPSHGITPCHAMP